MQATKVKMVSNNIKTAQFRLEQHRLMGTNSHLTIEDVANLLDMINKAESYIQPSSQPTIFQSIGFN
jgi:hypothetical protein